jgi:hypothetical protein
MSDEEHLADPTDPLSLWAYAWFTRKKKRKKTLKSGEHKEIT